MMRRWLVFTCLLVLLCVGVERHRLAVAQQFSSAQNLSNTPSPSTEPGIAIARATGNIHVVWADAGRILLRRTTGDNTNFGAAVTVAVGFSSTAEPDVAVDQTGNNIYVAFAATLPGGGGQVARIYFCRSTNAGANFSQPVVLSTGTQATAPALATDMAGRNVYVVWSEVNPDGRPVISLRRSSDGGVSFGPSLTLSAPADTRPSQPDVAVDQTTGVYVVWHSQVDSQTTPFRIRFVRSTNQAATFSAPTTISTTPGPSTEPAIAVDELGLFSIVWAENGGPLPGILHARSTLQGTLSVTRAIAPTSPGEAASHPNVAIDSSGAINVVGALAISGITALPAEVYFARSTNNGASFSSAVNLSQTAGNSILPVIAAQTTGNLAIAWDDNSTANREILFVRGVLAPAAVPDIDVAPTSLNFGNVNLGQSRDQSFTIRNVGNAALLIDALSINNPQFTLVSPSGVAGTELAIDDGSAESLIGLNQAGTIYCINRLRPSSYPATLSHVRIFFAGGRSNLSLGAALAVLVGVNPDGDENINGTNFQATNASVQLLDGFNTYDVPDVTISEGDFVVGFRMTIPNTVFPGALDTTPPSNRRSYFSSDGTTFALTPNVGIDGDWLIRGRLAGGLTIAPNGEQLVTVRFAPTAVGTQSGLLSITSNDPDESSVNVSLTGVGVQAPTGILNVSPTTLTFNTTVGQTTPPTMSFTVSNQGTAAFSYSISNNNPALVSVSPESGTLAGGQSNVITVVVTPPTQPGTRQAILTVTAPGAQNGVQSVTVTVNTTAPALPDFVVSQLTISPTSVQAGGQVLMNVSILNQGTGSAGAATHEVRLSSDAVITSADQLLLVITSNPLSPGAAATFTQLPVTIPAGTAPGPMFLGVIADAANAVAESNETNNIATVALTITSPQQAFNVVNIFPADRAQNVPQETRIQVDFSAPLVASSVTPQSLTLTTLAGQPIPGTVAAVGNRAFFFPSERLPAQTTFQIRLAASIQGRVEETIVRLGRDLLSTFTTEPAVARGQPPTDSGQPVRFDVGGVVTDDAQTGAMVRIPEYTLKTDVRVNIVVLDSDQRLPLINNQCDVPIDASTRVRPVAGFVRVSELVRFEAQPCDAVAFSPAMDMTIPLRSAFRGAFVVGTRLPLFQLAQTDDGLAFLDTGIEAEVTLPGTLFFGDFAIASGVEVFGTFALFAPISQASGRLRMPLVPSWYEVAAYEEVANSPTSVAQSSQQPHTLYFPAVFGQPSVRDTQLSFVNLAQNEARTVRLFAYNNDGSPHGLQQTILLPAGRRAAVLVSNLFPGLQGSIVARADGPVSGLYETANDFIDVPQVLTGVQAITSPQPAIVFPNLRTQGGAFTEIHIFNPNEADVQLRITAFSATGGEVLGHTLLLRPQEKLVRSSIGTSSGEPSLVIPFDQLDGGSLIVESLGGGDIVGVQLYGETMRNLAALNAVGLPAGCRATGTGSCQFDPLVPPAARQHSLFALYVDSANNTDVVVANVSDTDKLVAFSAFDSSGRFLASFPTRDFMPLPGHHVLRRSIASLFGSVASAVSYVRVEDQNSVLVGANPSQDRSSGSYLTTVQLAADLASQGLDAADLIFARLQNQPPTVTGLLVMNPNNNAVRFRIIVTDTAGNTIQSPPATAAPHTVAARGVYTFTRQSLSTLFPSVTSGHFMIRVIPDASPATGEKLLPVAIYRGANYVSAVMAEK
ncbi:MAG: choice-of-anchor D domain-containing protein [Acidobacteriota bacterium]|nr:choice-of-anchor D domain-containing protein [Blastocatellia bacterium]MDW8240277.1 choice-of-anchor D domain-containing protein [Acidobacteriota bacterium]